MELTYRQKQQLLVSYRNDGYELQVRLNAKGTVLDAEIVRIELLMDESAVVEVIAPSFFTQSEPFTCAYPTQQVSDFIDLANYTGSLTETPELQTVTSELSNEPSKVNEPVEEPKSFNQSTSALLPMQIVLWTLAIIIIPAVIVLWGFGNGVIKLVRVTIPLMDTATTKVLEGIVWLTELLWGSDYDEYSDSYLEIKHLLRN